MKELEFAEHSCDYEDSDGDKHTQTVEAVVLDKDNAYDGVDANGRPAPREFSVVGRSEKVKGAPGMVVVKTAKPDEYDIHTADVWKDMGFSPVKKSAASGK